MNDYFSKLQEEVLRAYRIAERARAKGFDPELKPEVPLAKDMAARVEGLVGPEGIAERIRELSKDHDKEEMAIILAKEIVEGKFHFEKFHLDEISQRERISEQALRTSLAVLTEGIVAAPLEGIVKTKIKKNQDGSSYLAIYFAGPIRSAGGSAQALAVLIGDYIRINLGLDRYKPTREEIERFVEEVDLYNAEAARLQYLPNPEEIRIAISNIPVEITGEGTEKIEVTGYRNLERIETNQLRGGAVLVLAEGVLQKAPKIIKHMKKFNLRWEWLEELASLRAGKKEEEEWEGESEIKIQPNYKYIKDLIAGRPVLSYPSEKGGLRLRYGRCRTSGFASACLHPATMVILDNFIAVGTQLKTERPGKAVAISACDTIEPPIVKLKDGSVVRVESVEQAEKIKNKIKEILFLGDILISYGDFLENNHVLMPSGYVEEWWEQEVERKGGKVGQTPTPEEALKISEELKVPLHPRYTYFFGNVTKEDLRELATWLCKGEIKNDYLEVEKSKEKRILEILCVPHEVKGNKVIIREYKPLLRVLGLLNDPQGSFKKFMEAYERAENPLQLVNSFGITVRDKAPTYIGARMGRPEKAKERKMQPPVNVLFPIGQAGGRTRDIKKAAQKNYVEVEVARRVCENCNEVTFKTLCPKCGGKTRYEKVEKRKIEIKELLNKAIQHVGNSSNDLKGVMGMTSEFKIPEPLEKGILRSKHRVYVFKDGTARFDATDLPMTHFKPKEIGISIEKLKELGYTHDYMGNPLESEEQVVELKCQDIILPERGGEYLLRVSKFIDELLTKLYGLEPYYKAEKKEDLIGHLVLGLAPHTSAAILGRIIGYSKTSACFAHPYWHAAKRRNCFPGETEVLVEIEGKPQRITFKELYEELYEDEYQEAMAYIRKKPKKNIKVFSYDTEKGKVVLTDIKHVMKSNSTDHLIKIELETGKSFETTYDHEVLIYENGGFKKKKAFEIKKGDLILLPKIDIEHDLHEIDLLQEFSKDKFKELRDIIMVRGIKKFVRKLVNEKGLKKVSKHLKINKKILNNYYGKRDSIPLSILLKLLELNDLSIDEVPNCYLGFKRDHTFIKRKIKLDNYLMRLIGFYLAEGHYRKGYNTYQVDIAAGEEDLREKIVNSFKKVFGNGFKPYIDENRVTIANRIIYHFFKDILELGKDAHSKRVPSFIFMLPEKKISCLLSSYFSGDGSVDISRKTITCSSLNKDLIRDIEFLLRKLGIFSSTYKFKRGKYTEYKLVIRGENVLLFDKVSFVSDRKERALKGIIKNMRIKPQMKYKQHRLARVKEVEYVKAKENVVYSLSAKYYHNIIVNEYILTSNCDGDEDSVFLLMDAFLNFSKYFLPSTRGGKMDAPLVLTTVLDPREVDEESHNMDIVSRYPLEFYEATLRYAKPQEVEDIIETVSKRIGSEKQYYGFSFTHDHGDINKATLKSSYKTLKTMIEKVEHQLTLARKIMAVDERDVARRVIESHFLPDLAGNLRAFSKQSFRCVNCNAKYRRVPLIGKCRRCGGKLVLTVPKGAVEKYLKVTKHLIDEYHLDDYLRQRIKILEMSISSVFEDDSAKQAKIFDF